MQEELIELVNKARLKGRVISFSEFVRIPVEKEYYRIWLSNTELAKIYRVKNSRNKYLIEYSECVTPKCEGYDNPWVTRYYYYAPPSEEELKDVYGEYEADEKRLILHLPPDVDDRCDFRCTKKVDGVEEVNFESVGVKVRADGLVLFRGNSVVVEVGETPHGRYVVIRGVS